MNKAVITGVASIAFAASALSQNVITDPGFEGISLGTIADNGGVTQWGNFNVTLDNCVVTDSISHSDSQSLLLNQFPTGSQGYSIVYQNTGTSVANVLGTWNWEFWVYTTDTTGSFNYNFQSSNNLNQDQNETGGAGSIDAASLTPSTWTPISGSFTVTSLSSTDLKASFSALNSSGTFYIDDVSLQAVPEPTSLALVAFGGLATLAAVRRRR